MQLSRIEQETIILFNEEEKFGEVETFNKVLQKKLDSFCEEFPEMFKLVDFDDEVGSKKYAIPKDNIQIRKPIVLSKKEKARRAKIARENIARTKK